eukprot:185592-Rhodomonas_salina.1
MGVGCYRHVTCFRSSSVSRGPMNVRILPPYAASVPHSAYPVAAPYVVNTTLREAGGKAPCAMPVPGYAEEQHHMRGQYRTGRRRGQDG